jgi:hypothetical protein
VREINQNDRKGEQLDPTYANIEAALKALGYDPQQADWPRSYSTWPAWAVSSAVLRQLGRSPSARGPVRHLINIRLERLAIQAQHAPASGV